MKLLWITDPHLECPASATVQLFLKTLHDTEFDLALVTGDISDSARLRRDLHLLASACAPRPLYVVLGNHDFYGSSFEEVRQLVLELCSELPNPYELGHGEIVPLNENEALIGHHGWSNSPTDDKDKPPLKPHDFNAIDDFKSAENPREKARELGRNSADYFRSVLPEALGKYKRVWVATHFPLFLKSARHKNKPTQRRCRPNFVNASAGNAIRDVAAQFMGKDVAVLCGHTHAAAEVTVGANINIMTGAVTRGKPRIQRVFDLP